LIPWLRRGRRRTAKTGPDRLDAGDPFPSMEWRLVDGGTLKVPDHHAGRWSVILLYRGHW
jgi:hypothetical protein